MTVRPTLKIAKRCATCKHFLEVDARAAVMDPSGIYTVCAWKPLQPYWMRWPFQGHMTHQGVIPTVESIRKPSDGKDCPVWESGAVVSKIRA